MEDTSSLYWCLLETDTDNPELYFPPDTPVGGANPKKLYTLYQKRHARQKERLLKQQVAELYKYRESFSADLKDNNSTNTPATVCELITGNDFLINESDAISQLLFGIPSFTTQEPTRKENEKTSKTNDTEAKKQEYLEDFTKRFKAGSGNLEKNYQLQLNSLERLQKSDINNIPREVLIELDPKRYKPHSSSPELTHGDRRKDRDSRKDNDNDRKRRKDDYRARSPVKDYRRERSPLKDTHRPGPYGNTSSSSSPPPPPPPPFPSTQRGNYREPVYISPLPTSSSRIQLNQAPLPPASIVGIPNSARPPTVISSPVTATQGPPTVQFSLSAAYKSGPPTVQLSSFKNNARPPSVGSSSSTSNPHNASQSNKYIPPYVAKPSTHFTQPHEVALKKQKSPATLLFTPRAPRKIEALTDKGSLIIYNKPSRVLIRQPDGTAKAYGNPKDYDDAIHSRTSRPDNPVYKRHMNGVDYLFYKTDTGNVVTIGPVSKIQPLIHKYFLSI